VKLDHCYAKKLTYEQTISGLKKTVASIIKTIGQLQRNVRRKQTRLNSMWEKLKEKNLVSEDDEDFISQLNPTVRALLNTQKKSKNSGIRYENDVKQFSVTLHFHSPKAYRFLRSHLSLPHESTLTSWMRNSNCDPGVCTDIISRLAKVRANDCSNSLTDIVIQLDEMSIRKDTPFDASSHRFLGHVDYGLGDVGDSAPLATNALVCLAVGISGGWKIPVGYIFTNKVDGDIMFNYVSRILDSLASQKFRVHGIITDGYSANVNMFRKFGVKEPKTNFSTILTLDDINYSFNYPAQENKVHVIFDVVHMMKLLRNMLASYEIIEWLNGQICWKYIVELERLQRDEGIRAGNKLVKNHIEFEKHKTKVKLATQVLSSSVAKAIDFCRDDLQLPQFAGSESTTEFLRMVDGMFDILN